MPDASVTVLDDTLPVTDTVTPDIALPPSVTVPLTVYVLAVAAKSLPVHVADCLSNGF